MSTKPTEVLFTPYTLGDLQLKNRIVMAPLTRTRAENQGKVPNELMTEYYAQRAGAGLIITEGTFVSEQGQGWYGAPGIYTAEQAAGWKRVTDAVHSAGGLIFVQLWHQGSVSHRSLYDDGRLPLGPSAVNPEQLIHVKGGKILSEIPREMSLHDIKQAVKDFRHAAQVARDAGFDGVQIQGGFVYLFQQFLHEVTNRRTDQYGGPVENRARLLFEALEAVLEVWPSNRVGVKAGPMMSEHGAFRATDETLRTSEYVYRKMADYKLSHMLLMRQMADLTGTPIEHMSGDAVVHHFRRTLHWNAHPERRAQRLKFAREIIGGARLANCSLGFVTFFADSKASPAPQERQSFWLPLGKGAKRRSGHCFPTNDPGGQRGCRSGHPGDGEPIVMVPGGQSC